MLRMKSILCCLAALTALLVQAEEPAGFVFWPKGIPSGDPKSAKFENHALSVSHRDKDGVAELHEKQADIVVVQSGEATLVVGGELVDRKGSGPNEFRGSSIKDGVSNKLSAGDVFRVPAGMPHQFFVPAGKQITYFVVKVDKP
jgi:mannose-6-phosphate isomerase-like protein (cupin superfamily)